MPLKSIRLLLFVLIGLVAAGNVLYFGAAWLTKSESSAAGLIPPTNTIGGPFSVVDQSGAPVTDKDLAGRPTAMFFGYTFCPDVCPTTLAEMSEWLKALGPAGERLQVVFVTVDPTRDTPEKLKDYLGSFDPHIRGFTGSPEAIGGILKAYRVFARKVPSETGGDYLMDHTAGIYLMNAKGLFVGLINYQEDSDKAIAKLKALIAQG